MERIGGELGTWAAVAASVRRDPLLNVGPASGDSGDSGDCRMAYRSYTMHKEKKQMQGRGLGPGPGPTVGAP
jgi:hypothetical protein